VRAARASLGQRASAARAGLALMGTICGTRHWRVFGFPFEPVGSLTM
jgi:hypothetical protein